MADKNHFYRMVEHIHMPEDKKEEVREVLMREEAFLDGLSKKEQQEKERKRFDHMKKKRVVKEAGILMKDLIVEKSDLWASVKIRCKYIGKSKAKDGETDADEAPQDRIAFSVMDMAGKEFEFEEGRGPGRPDEKGVMHCWMDYQMPKLPDTVKVKVYQPGEDNVYGVVTYKRLERR